jgi:deoxycytidine triphosphate deaminase
MILSDNQIRARDIVSPCEERQTFRGKSFGLSACGYDVRVDLSTLDEWYGVRHVQTPDGEGILLEPGKSVLVGVQELFHMPDDVVGFPKDKSTWLRQGVFIGAPVLEPGWRGFPSLRLFNMGDEEIAIVDGEPIAQVVFQLITGEVEKPYDGKYQNAGPGSQGPILE